MTGWMKIGLITGCLVAAGWAFSLAMSKHAFLHLGSSYFPEELGALVGHSAFVTVVVGFVVSAAVFGQRRDLIPRVFLAIMVAAIVGVLAPSMIGAAMAGS